MASRRRAVKESAEQESFSSAPAKQDEADILQEIETETDENGELKIDEDTAREVGALDATAIRENRRVKDVVGKKRANVKNVSFNTGDILSTYDALIQLWPPNTLDINVRRLTGSPIQFVIMSRPRSGAELYDALVQQVHKDSDEAQYELKIVDSSRKEFRSVGRITLPDRRGLQGQGAAPMGQPNPYYPPAPPPAAPLPAAPGAMDVTAVLQLLQMVKAIQQDSAVQVTAPPVVQPAQDPNAALLQQLAALLQPQAAPPAPAPNPIAATAPPLPTSPPGQFWIPGFGYAPVERVMALFGAAAPTPPQPRQVYQGDDGYRPARPPPRYGSSSNGEPPPYAPYRPQPAAVVQAESPQQAFKEAMGTLRSAMSMINEFQSIMPRAAEGGGFEPPEPPQERDGRAREEDESPVRVIDTGGTKIVMSKDGTLRGWETAFANADKMLRWVGEQTDAIRVSAQRRQAPPEPTQTRRLPPNYVEVGPGYTPPPGYRAVAVDPNEDGLAQQYQQPPQQSYAPSQPHYAQQQPPLPPPPLAEELPPPVGADSAPSPATATIPWGSFDPRE